MRKLLVIFILLLWMIKCNAQDTVRSIMLVSDTCTIPAWFSVKTLVTPYPLSVRYFVTGYTIVKKREDYPKGFRWVSCYSKMPNMFRFLFDDKTAIPEKIDVYEFALID